MPSTNTKTVTVDLGQSHAGAGLVLAGTSTGRVLADFPTKLAASKAAGVQGIRLSTVSSDFHIEELGAGGKTIRGFILHPITNSAKKVVSIAVTQMGSNKGPSPLSAAQRAAFALIRDELSRYKALGPFPVDNASNGASAPVGAVKPMISKGEFLGALDAAFACAAAVVEGGINPIADAGCAIAYSIFVDSQSEGGNSDPIPDPPPNLDIPDDSEETTISSSSTSQDDPPPDEGGGDGGGGGGGKLRNAGDPVEEEN